MSTAEQLLCQLARAVYETQSHLVASELQLDIKAEKHSILSHNLEGPREKMKPST